MNNASMREPKPPVKPAPKIEFIEPLFPETAQISRLR